MNLTAEQWNAAYPIGTPVTAYPGINPAYAAEIGATDYPRLETRTRSRAWNLGPEPVVMVEGYAGGIHLEHIDLRTEDRPMSTQPQPLDLDAIQARLDAATDGPWWNDEHEIYAGEVGDYSRQIGEVCDPDHGGGGANNGEFIARARTDVEQLLAQVRELEAEVERLAKDRDFWLEVTRDARNLIATAATPQQALDEVRELLNP